MRAIANAVCMLLSIIVTPMGDGLRRGVRYNDADPAIQGIADKIALLGEQIKAAASASEVKSLAEQLTALQTALNALTAQVTAASGPASEAGKAVVQLNDLTGKLQLRLDTIERNLNRSAINGGGRGRAGNLTFGQQKALDAAMRSGAGVQLNDLPTGLKTKSIFLEGAMLDAYPLLEAADKRPCGGDVAHFGFFGGAAVRRKGVGGSAQTQGAWVDRSVTLGVYDYQPTIPYTDVADAGAAVLDYEQEAAGDAVLAAVNADAVNAIETRESLAAAPGFDATTNVVYVESSVAGVWTESDLHTLVASLTRRYRRGAAFVMSTTTAAQVRSDVVDDNGRSLWIESLATGGEATLLGYPVHIEDDYTDGRIAFGNPKRGLCVAERQGVVLESMERLNGDYKPYFAGRFAADVKDCAAWKVMRRKA